MPKTLCGERNPERFFVPLIKKKKLSAKTKCVIIQLLNWKGLLWWQLYRHKKVIDNYHEENKLFYCSGVFYSKETKKKLI